MGREKEGIISDRKFEITDVKEVRTANGKTGFVLRAKVVGTPTEMQILMEQDCTGKVCLWLAE